jgi:RimJ/RimL family protein N-acetyltransferase
MGSLDEKMRKEDIYLTGNSVVIKTVKENDIEDYLHVKRYATIFKSAYDKENELWEYMKSQLVDDISGNDCICLIYLKNTGRVIGYIELELKNVHRPQVGIGILEEDRKKGYALEASRLLLQKFLKYEEIECIEWMTTSANAASNRIAQRLGGKIIRKEPIISGELLDRLEDEIIKKEIPYCVVYGIYRE